jgi:hypothetical protein
MPPATVVRRRRGGRADRRQIQVLVLTAHYLRRRRGTTASVFGRMPLALGPPLCSDTPHLSTRRKEYRSVLAGTQICEGGYFENCCEFRKRWALEQSSKVPNFCARRNVPMAKLQRRLFCAVSCQPAMGTKGNECASKRRPLGRAFEASLADAQLEPAESLGMRAVHFRSRIPAMALT